MLKYRCLVLDHDDTVVQSEETVNYPYFCEILDILRPGVKISLQEYTYGCYHKGFIPMCRDKYNFTDEEFAIEYAGWKHYIESHIPAPYDGIKELIRKQKEAGGQICVVSHSTQQNISRDYITHFEILPDSIYGWDYPEHQRKPSTYPLEQIMQLYNLSPADILVVDDMKPAWEMAKNAGVDIAFAGWGRSNYPEIIREMSSLCKYSFYSVDDLTKFLFE